MMPVGLIQCAGHCCRLLTLIDEAVTEGLSGVLPLSMRDFGRCLAFILKSITTHVETPNCERMNALCALCVL